MAGIRNEFSCLVPVRLYLSGIILRMQLKGLERMNRQLLEKLSLQKLCLDKLNLVIMDLLRLNFKCRKLHSLFGHFLTLY